jgi:hypothetical protein
MREYGDERVLAHLDDIKTMFTRTQPEVTAPDNFSAVPMSAIEEMRELFAAPFYFGCEADDPMNAHAFNRDVNPFGVALQALLGSDNAHWDVVDMKDVLHEAYEQVEHGVMTADDFRDFAFTNPVRLHAGMNPDFFTGTRVENAVKEVMATT